MKTTNLKNWTRRCSICKIWKSLEVFKNNASRSPVPKDYLCKKCHYIKTKERSNSLEHRLKYRYGLSLEEYHKILINQNKKCALCGISKESKRLYLYVDHDHETKKVRGLLCPNCNRNMAALDTKGWLEKALIYQKGLN